MTSCNGVRSGISFTYATWMTEEAAVELYIDTGDRDENKRIFVHLSARKPDIERAFGAPLSWERMDGKRASRIRFVIEQGGLIDEPKHSAIQDAMISAMDRFAKAVKPHLSDA